MIPDDRPGYWQAMSLALHQSLADLATTVPGLAQPPLTATSIPAGSRSSHPVLPRDYRSLRPGLPPPLAAGNGVLDLESNQVSVTCPNRAQGWVDCYQDPQNCAICHQPESQSVFHRLISAGLWKWHTGHLDHLLQRHGFEHAQVDTCIAGLSPYNYAVGAELDEPCAPAPPHISTDTTGKLPKAAIVTTTQCASRLVVTVPGSGVLKALAPRNGGRSLALHVVAPSENMVDRLLRLAPRPSSRTTWETHDVRAAGGIMPSEPIMKSEPVSSETFELTPGTRCLARIDCPPCWTWKAWIDPVQLSLTLDNFETPRLCRVQEKQVWAPSFLRITAPNNHHLSHRQSHPGPKAGGRLYPLVLLRTPDQSTGARVTSACHSLVEPEVPHVGSNGKPWREQNLNSCLRDGPSRLPTTVATMWPLPSEILNSR